jgi:hypothetical protein
MPDAAFRLMRQLSLRLRSAVPIGVIVIYGLSLGWLAISKYLPAKSTDLPGVALVQYPTNVVMPMELKWKTSMALSSTLLPPHQEDEATFIRDYFARFATNSTGAASRR